jgi:hypothetical protein
MTVLSRWSFRRTTGLTAPLSDGMIFAIVDPAWRMEDEEVLTEGCL